LLKGCTTLLQKISNLTPDLPPPLISVFILCQSITEYRLFLLYGPIKEKIKQILVKNKLILSLFYITKLFIHVYNWHILEVIILAHVRFSKFFA